MRAAYWHLTVRGQRRRIGKTRRVDGLGWCWRQKVDPALHVYARDDAYTLDDEVVAFLEALGVLVLILWAEGGEQASLTWADFVRLRYRVTTSEHEPPKWAVSRRDWKHCPLDPRGWYGLPDADGDVWMRARLGENVGDSRPAAAVRPDLAAAVTQLGERPDAPADPPAMPTGWDPERWARVIRHGWPVGVGRVI